MALISGGRSSGLPMGWGFMPAPGEVGSVVWQPPPQSSVLHEVVERYRAATWNGPYRWDEAQRRYVQCLEWEDWRGRGNPHEVRTREEGREEAVGVESEAARMGSGAEDNQPRLGQQQQQQQWYWYPYPHPYNWDFRNYPNVWGGANPPLPVIYRPPPFVVFSPKGKKEDEEVQQSEQEPEQQQEQEEDKKRQGKQQKEQQGLASAPKAPRPRVQHSCSWVCSEKCGNRVTVTVTVENESGGMGFPYMLDVDVGGERDADNGWVDLPHGSFVIPAAGSSQDPQTPVRNHRQQHYSPLTGNGSGGGRRPRKQVGAETPAEESRKSTTPSTTASHSSYKSPTVEDADDELYRCYSPGSRARRSSKSTVCANDNDGKDFSRSKDKGKGKQTGAAVSEHSRDDGSKDGTTPRARAPSSASTRSIIGSPRGPRPPPPPSVTSSRSSKSFRRSNDNAIKKNGAEETPGATGAGSTTGTSTGEPTIKTVRTSSSPSSSTASFASKRSSISSPSPSVASRHRKQQPKSRLRSWSERAEQVIETPSPRGALPKKKKKKTSWGAPEDDDDGDDEEEEVENEDLQEGDNSAFGNSGGWGDADNASAPGWGGYDDNNYSENAGSDAPAQASGWGETTGSEWIGSDAGDGGWGGAADDGGNNNGFDDANGDGEHDDNAQDGGMDQSWVSDAAGSGDGWGRVEPPLRGAGDNGKERKRGSDGDAGSAAGWGGW